MGKKSFNIKKIIAITLSLILVMSCSLTTSFAKGNYDEITLEMEMENGDYGNYGNYFDKENLKFQLEMAYWSRDEIIKTVNLKSVKDFEVLEGDRVSKDTKLKYCGKNQFALKAPKSNKNKRYVIRYTGKFLNRMTNDSVELYVYSSKLFNGVKKAKYNSLKVSGSEEGNKVTWKQKKSKFMPAYTEIYRSKSKHSGFKHIGTVAGNKRTYLDDSDISKNCKYYYKVRGSQNFDSKNAYSEYSAVAKAAAKATFPKDTMESLNKKTLSKYNKNLLAEAPLYGVSKNISWIDKPKTREDYRNNMIYSCLVGNYEMNFAFPKGTKREELEAKGEELIGLMGDIASTYPDLAGWYINSSWRGNYKYEVTAKSFYPVIRIYEPGNTPSKIMKERKAVMEEAKRYRDSLYSSGVLNESMSDMEKLNAYYRVLDQYANPPIKEKPYLVSFDTSYGFFIKKQCFCGGWASGVSALLHLEGIKCAGVNCTDHITTMVKIDGKYYVIDAGNRVPLKTLSEAMNYEGYGEFYTDSIKNAKVAMNLYN